MDGCQLEHHHHNYPSQRLIFQNVFSDNFFKNFLILKWLWIRFELSNMLRKKLSETFLTIVKTELFTKFRTIVCTKKSFFCCNRGVMRILGRVRFYIQKRLSGQKMVKNQTITLIHNVNGKLVLDWVPFMYDWIKREVLNQRRTTVWPWRPHRTADLAVVYDFALFATKTSKQQVTLLVT